MTAPEPGAPMTPQPPIDVAVGVILRDDGSFLLARRPAGKPMAGWWEFPGGKLEAGESVLDALVREFDEELGLEVLTAQPWVQRVVTYPHATVRLHFWRSIGEGRGWRGVPRSNEGQDFRWERIERLTTDPWLKGAEPVKRWLRLPPVYAISNAATVGLGAFLAALDRRIASGTLGLLQLREPGLDGHAFDALFEAVRARCDEAGVRLLVNSHHPGRYWTRGSGVHLTTRTLATLTTRPDVDWCVASCHGTRDLARAGDLGVDAAVLGPVAATATHPDTVPLGWPAFAAIAGTTTVPVYALGGMTQADLPAAQAAGAHGVAMIRGAWR